MLQINPELDMYAMEFGEQSIAHLKHIFLSGWKRPEGVNI